MSTKGCKRILKDVMNTEDKSSDFDKKSMTEGKTMAILSYIIHTYFVEKDNKYVKFHQGKEWIYYVVGICICYIIQCVSRA